MFNPAMISKAMAIATKASDVVIGECQGESGINKGFDSLESLCWEPGAEVRLVTLKIGGKSVVILAAGEPGALAEVGM